MMRKNCREKNLVTVVWLLRLQRCRSLVTHGLLRLRCDRSMNLVTVVWLVVSTIALAALLASPAQAELVWPKEWAAFGPAEPDRGMTLGGLPDGKSLLPGEILRTIPQELVIRGQKFAREKVLLTDNAIDLGRWFDGVERGKTVYLFARINAEEDMQAQIGTGADWFMQWWLDGQPIYDTLGTGNQAFPIAITNHVFSVSLTKGEHILAVAVISGSNSFVFAAGGPKELEMATSGKRKSPAQVRAEAEEILANEKVGAYQRAEAHLAIAKTYFDEQNYPKAREEYAKIFQFQSHPFYVGEAHLGTGDTYWQEGKFREAVEAYRTVLKTEGCRKEHLAAVNKKLDAIYLMYRVRPEHPRLFLNQDIWPAMKARALGEDKQTYENMKKVVDDLPPPEEIQSKDWGSSLVAAAFVYRMTGEQALLDKIKKMLRASLDFYHQAHAQCRDWGDTRKYGLNYPFTRIAWLTALDWVWNDLTPPERKGLATGMLNHVCEHLMRWPNVRYYGMAFYCSDNIYWYAGLTLLNEELSDTDYLRALRLLEEGYYDHQRMFKIRGDARGDDGDFTTPQIEYTLPADSHAEWSFLHSWQSAISQEIPDQWSHSALFPNYVFWNALPGFRHYGLSFAWHTSNWIGDAYVGAYLAQHMHFYGQSHPELAALSRYLWEQLGCKGSGKYGYVPIWTGLWSRPDKAPPANVPANLPMARHFEGSGTVFMRSGHGEKDTYALFNAGGAKFGSGHYDATHFTIYKQGFLALDTGTRNCPGHSNNYYPQTVAHNCVLIRMPEEAFKGEWLEPVEVNSAGQNRFPRFAKTLAFETGPFFSYAASDATETYNPEKCSQMVRQFIFLPPDHFVVFDRVFSKKSEYPKTWLLHTANEPVITGKEFRADQGAGRILVRTLYPTDAVLEEIGGPGKEFWADGKNWALTDDWWARYAGVLRGKPLKKGEIAETMGRWRVEVKPGQAREEDYFLHLIQVSDQTVEKMITSKVSETANQIQLTFTVGARTYTISLNKTGEIGGHIRITEGRKVLVDRDLTREIMPQSGLALTK